jgi:predicted transcriptional regulator
MIIANTSKNSLIHCDIVKVWANSIPLMRLLMKEDNLYLDELFLLYLINRLCNESGRPITKTEVIDNFPMLSYKRNRMLDSLLSKGLINNLREGPRKHGNGFRLVLTSKGEQLLIKYKKAMERLCNGS